MLSVHVTALNVNFYLPGKLYKGNGDGGQNETCQQTAPVYLRNKSC